MFLSESKAKVIPRREPGYRKGAAENKSGNSGQRRLEAESNTSRAQSTEGKLKAATEIRRSSARDTFIAESTVFPLYRILCGIGSLQVDK